MSNDTLHVKPAGGLVVRDPETKAALPSDGGRVPNNSYWRRRLAAGDVTRVAPQAARKPSKKNEA